MIASATSNREVEILERAIDPDGETWAPEVARAFLSMKFSSSDVARMNELAAKARDGTLSSDEELEIDSYRTAGRVLEILALRARISLKRAGMSDPTTP